jgi:hypothetical protein
MAKKRKKMSLNRLIRRIDPPLVFNALKWFFADFYFLGESYFRFSAYSA